MERGEATLPLRAIAAGVALAAIGVPTAAAGTTGTTRIVDDDGRGSVASCDAPAPASNTIQKGIDASRAGDTVLVCPGEYTEQVEIGPAKDRVTLRSRIPFAAGIRRPRVMHSRDGGYPPLVHVAHGADRVSVVGFRIVFRSGTDCRHPGTGVLINGSNAIVRANRIFTAGARTFDACGFDTGIAVMLSDDGPPYPSAAIAYNTIKDYQFDGILVAQSRTYIAHNSVRFTHAKDRCPPFGEEGPSLRAGARRDVERIGRGVQRRNDGRHRALAQAAGAGGQRVCVAVGIALFDAHGSVFDNNVYSGTSSFSAGQDTPVPFVGVLVAGDLADGPVAVRDNLVARAAIGIALEQAALIRVERNVVRLAYDGVGVGRTWGSEIIATESHDNLNGIVVDEESESNVLRDNDARGNHDVDCVDESRGRRTARTANTWTGNLGHDSRPRGLCRPGG